MAQPTSPADPDPVLCGRLRSGDDTAVAALVRRHGAAAELLAAVAAGGPSAAAGDAVAGSWESLLRAVIRGERTDGLRPALLAGVLDALHEAGQLDTAPTPPLPEQGPYLGPDDRWAGWWADYPPTWPPARPLDRARLVAAVRSLPMRHRLPLVLRDAAGLGARAAAAIIGISEAYQETLLAEARVGLLGHLDASLTGNLAGSGAS